LLTSDVVPLSTSFTKRVIRDDAAMLDVSVAATTSPGLRSDTVKGSSGINSHVSGLSSSSAPSSKSSVVTSWGGGDGGGGGLGGGGDGGEV
jgi:uncharacterized membrane protein